MDALSRTLATFVLNSLWQVIFIASAAVLADLLLRRAPARHRHLLWIASLAATLLVPLAGMGVRAREVKAPAGTSSEVSPASPTGAQAEAAFIRSTKAHSNPGWWVRLAPVRTHRIVSPSRQLLRAAAALYFCFTMLMLARFARAWLKTRAIRRRALAVEPWPEPVQQAMETCRLKLTGGRSVRHSPQLLSSPAVPGPVTVGVQRPTIILPPSMLDSGGPEDLTAALAHEMAHICRRDYLWNLVYELLFLPVAFHPLARLILRRIGDTRELACDELAAQALSTSAYARSLVRIAHHMSQRASATLAPNYTLGVFDANILEERIMRLMKPRASSRLAKFSFVSAAILISSLSFAAVRFSIAVAQPAISAAGAQAAKSGPALAKFAGTWAAKFEGKTYVQLTLRLQDRHLTGTIGTGDVNLDPSGSVKEVTQEARAPVAISGAKVEDGRFYFKQRDGDEDLSYEMEVVDPGRAQLRVLTGGSVTVQPFKLTRDGSAEAVSQAAVRQVVYTDTAHVVKGAVSGVVSNGVAGGVSGTISGGTGGGVAGGVSGTISGA